MIPKHIILQWDMCGGCVIYNYNYPRWTLDWGVTSWGSSTDIYVNTRVLSQCLLLPAHAIGKENESTRISAHVLFWYAIVS